MEIAFWVCAFGAAYSYFCYPLVLLLMVRRRPAGAFRREVEPENLCVVVAARNEEANIVAKLENTLALERDGCSVDIVVASDASDDSTDNLVRGYAARGVRLVRSPERRGKEVAQKRALDAITSDIVVFTDAGTMLPPDSIARLRAAFADPTVGAVSSVDRLLAADGTVDGEGLYLRYEMWLRDLETRAGSLVGLSGSFFAARRVVCRDWDVSVPSDFGTALNCVRAGFRAISDRSVVGLYKTIADPRREYARKVRTVTRGMKGLARRREVLNPFRYGKFAFQVFSHKVMRWAVPWFLVGALASSAVLAPHSAFYATLLLLQLLGYAAAVLARVLPALLRVPLVKPWTFFVEANAAIVHATLRVLRGEGQATWEPSKR
jgi:glycosyltransferase involved in cell wall biosynthesis